MLEDTTEEQTEKWLLNDYRYGTLQNSRAAWKSRWRSWIVLIGGLCWCKTILTQEDGRDTAGPTFTEETGSSSHLSQNDCSKLHKINKPLLDRAPIKLCRRLDRYIETLNRWKETACTTQRTPAYPHLQFSFHINLTSWYVCHYSHLHLAISTA